MEFSIKSTNSGINISLSEKKEEPPSRSHNIDMANPRRHYIYAHLDSDGNVFYIGKGQNRRAWSKERHCLWSWYVERHLGDDYTIEILNDNLDENVAEHIETEWISFYNESLVNWINMEREYDENKLEIYHTKRNANRSLIAEARLLEKVNLEKATSKYIKAIKDIHSYCSIVSEGGLVGKLLKERIDEFGCHGELETIDRLSLCLIRLGKPTEAIEHVNKYFEDFPCDIGFVKAQKMLKRIEKAKKQLKLSQG